MSDAVQSEQVANMAKGWVRAPLDIPPLPVQERIIGAVDDQITTLDTEAEAATALRAGLLAESLTTSQGEEWEEVRLSEVSSSLAGPAFKASVFASTPVGPRLLRGINLGRSGTRWNDADTVFWPEVESGAFQKYVLEPGDVCIAMDRPFTRDRVLRCGLIQNADLPALLVQRVTRLRANLNRIMPEFLIFVVQSPSMAERLAGRQTPGGYAPHISGRDISEFTFALPPLSAQERIVEVIGAVDDQITAIDGEAEAAERVRDRLLDEFTGAAASDTKPLGELCPAIGSGPSWAAKDESSVPSEGALTVLKITNTRPDGSIDLSELAYVAGLPARTKVIGPASLVMIRTNGNRKRIGNVYLPPEEVHGAAVSAFQFTLDALDAETRDYLYLVLRSPGIQHLMSESASGSTGLGNLAVRWLKTLEIPWPNALVRESQVEAVRAIDAKIAAIRTEAALLREVRAGLLSGLLDRTIDIESAELEV